MSKFKLFNYFDYLQNKKDDFNIYKNVKEHKDYIQNIPHLYKSNSSQFYSTVKNNRFPFINENKENNSEEKNLTLKTFKKINKSLNISNYNNFPSLYNRNKKEPFRNHININNLFKKDKEEENYIIKETIEKEKENLMFRYNQLLKLGKPIKKKLNGISFSNFKYYLEEKLKENIYEDKKRNLNIKNQRIIKDFKNQNTNEFKYKIKETGTRIKYLELKLNKIVKKIPSILDKDYDDIMVKMDL